MKKGLVLLLCCTLLLPCLLSLASCGGDGAPDEGPYTVAFVIDGRETKTTVERGETPVCPEELLSWETEEHYYKVTGWDKEIVPAESDATYTAIVGEYGLTIYDVRFYMPDKTIVAVPTHEGEVPTPPAGYETDLSRVDKIGRFVGWTCSVEGAGDGLIPPTAENMEGKKVMVYTPNYVYDETRYFTVTFVVGDAEYKVQTAGNTLPVCPVDPASVASASDPFVGWDKTIEKATKDETYTAWYGNELFAEILPAKDGAKAILTMTYDDGDYDTAVWVNRMNKRYGLRGSCMLIAGRASLTSRIDDWKKIFADGTLEPECHSMNHTKDTIEGTQATYRNEVVNSKAKLEEYFPDHRILCYATPYCQVRDFSYKAKADGSADTSQKIKDGGSKKLIEETYFVNRNGPSGFQSLDPTPDANEGGWYNPYVQWFYNKTSQTDAIRTAWIDSAVAQGKWLIILAHQIVDEPSTEYQLKKSNAETFYKHAAPYIESGELWAATFGEATKYIRERQGATAYRKMGSGAISVGLKIDRTTPDGHYMDQDVFNEPLTVRVRVPSGWNTAAYDFSGKTVNATCYDADGHRYVNVNIVPGGDGAVVSVLVNRVD